MRYVKYALLGFLFGLILGSLQQAFAEERAYAKLRMATLHLSIGSGFIVKGQSQKHYLMTNWHVCNPSAFHGKLHGNYEDGTLVTGPVVKKDPVKDLCVARVLDDFNALEVADTLYNHQTIYTRGYPYGILSENSGQFLSQMTWAYSFAIEEVGECFKGSEKEYDGYGKLVA